LPLESELLFSTVSREVTGEKMREIRPKHIGTYGLTFLTDDALFEHVRQTVEKYRFHISLDDFNKNGSFKFQVG